MKRLLLATALAVCSAVPAAADDVDVSKIIKQLNETRSVKGTDDQKSYLPLFDAFLEMTPPPRPVGADFNHFYIHPGMSDWSSVRDWAESNRELVDAIIEAGDKTLFGLPYGREAVAERFREADLVADIAPGGELRFGEFPYTAAVDTISALACAEAYRLLEAGDGERAMDVQMAIIFVLRQCCDREFIEEQLYAMVLLTEALANLRDMLYTHAEAIPSTTYIDIAQRRLPFLRPDAGRLFMPEGDKIVSEALIKQVFDDQGQPDPDMFATVFAPIQATDAALTRFGAAARWRQIALVHDSETTSLTRLRLLYDDWWRRWRVEEYDPILRIPTELSRTNPVRYAAVVFSIQDLTDLRTARNVLMSQVYGTTVAAGIAGYHRARGAWPRDIVNVHGTYLNKSANRDPFDEEFRQFKMSDSTSRSVVDTAWGRLSLPSGMTMLWSLGDDNDDDRAREHSDDGTAGDILIWPPVKALLREEGLME